MQGTMYRVILDMNCLYDFIWRETPEHETGIAFPVRDDFSFDLCPVKYDLKLANN